MNFKKSTIAAASAVVLAVAVCAGSISASGSIFDKGVEHARVMFESYLNKKLSNTPDRHYSVAIQELKRGVFSRELMFVAYDGKDAVKIPVSADLGLFNYDLKFDFAHARLNDEYLIKVLNFNTLTAIDTNLHISALRRNATLHGNIQFLNNLGQAELFKDYVDLANNPQPTEDVAANAENPQNVDEATALKNQMAERLAEAKKRAGIVDKAPSIALTPEGGVESIAKRAEDKINAMVEAELAGTKVEDVSVIEQALDSYRQEINFKPVGTLDFIVNIDSDGRIKSSLNLDNLSTEGVAITNLNMFSDSEFLSKNQKVGTFSLSASRIALPQGLEVNRYYNDVVLKTDSGRIKNDGTFDTKYEISIGNGEHFNSSYLHGSLNRLSYNVVRSFFVGGENTGALTNLYDLLYNGTQFTIDKGSHANFEALYQKDAASKLEPASIPFDATASIEFVPNDSLLKEAKAKHEGKAVENKTAQKSDASEADNMDAEMREFYDTMNFVLGGSVVVNAELTSPYNVNNITDPKGRFNDYFKHLFVVGKDGASTSKVQYESAFNTSEPSKMIVNGEVTLNPSFPVYRGPHQNLKHVK